MAPYFFLIAVLLLLVLDVARFTVSIQSLAERPSCNSTFTSLRELQAAINRTETVDAADYVFCVNLQPYSVEYIGYSLSMIDSIGLIITGSSQGVGNDGAAPVVKCETNLNSRDLSLNEYPLAVTNSSLVVIEGVQFEGCMRPLQFNQVQRVELLHSKFRNFNPGGALDIFRCSKVVVSSCIFSNNTNLGLGNRSYSGNAGGMAIGYDENNEAGYHPNIKITDSIIEYNQASGSSNFQREASLLLKRRVFKQRGGGIAFYFGTRSSSAHIEILRCSFIGNYARSAGGGLYINLLGENNSHIIVIRECNFTSNSAYIGAGMVTFYNPVTNASLLSAEILAHTVSIIDCIFVGNSGQYGGALSNIQLGYLNTLNVTNCTFVENEGTLGAALYLQFLFTTLNFVPEKKLTIEDCMFRSNTARNGALFATRNTVRIQGDTLFKENTGPAIQALSSLIRLSGHVVFDSNRHYPSGHSGVIYLSAFGQILLEMSVDILFRNNTGREGASIVVVGQSLSADLTEQLYNPQCFLQYVVPTAPPPTWKVTLSFEDNQAVVGPVVYMSGVSACIWNSTSSPFFSYDFQDIPKVWDFMSMSDNFILRGVEAINEPDYYIQTTVEYLSISLQDNQIFGSPGESIVVKVDALDELMHNTSAFLQMKVADSSVTFVPSVVQTVAGVGEINFMYLSNNFSGNTTVQIIPSFTASDTESVDDFAATLTLVHEPCLPGYFRMNKRCVCEEDDVIVLCGPKSEGLLLSDGLWGSFSTLDRKLVTHVCPPGYCDCNQRFQNASEDVGCLLEYSDPSTICDKTRTGMFCGKCRGGEGVGLLTNNCRSFNSRVPQFWAFLIYLIVLVPLLVAIVKLGVHLPTVLRGLIFYIQISPIAVEFLPQSFKLKVDIVSFIGSALGLYMPYDFSFHKGMTSLESYGLRYIAPLVALIVVPLAVRFRHPHSKYWYGVWTVIQLMFIMSIRTSVSLLLCPTLIGSKVWFFDGSVQCYHGWHILLAVVALLSLFALVFLVILIAAALKFKFLRRKVYHGFSKLEPFSLALTKGIKRGYWWWPIVDLTCKYMLVLTVVYMVGQKVLALVNILILLFIQFFVHPYKNKMANYLESFALLVLIMLLGLGNTPAFVETVDVVLWPLFYLPIFVEIVIITVYVGYILCWKQFRQKLSTRSKTKDDPNKRSIRIAKRQDSQATQSEVSIFDLHEDENNEFEVDAEFTLWEESTDM